MPEENMKSLMKTFDILELFLERKSDMSMTEISLALGLHKATVNRILIKLTQRGYLRQKEKRGKYSLGTIFLEFSGIVKKQLKIREIALPYLLQLNRLVKESVIIGVNDDKKGVITETFHEASISPSPLKVIPDEGISLPLYCTCLGKIILADMESAELQRYLDSTHLEKRTQFTIVDAKRITDQLQSVRQEEIAFDYEEYALGVLGIAAGIRDHEGRLVGSVGILVPSARASKEKIQNYKVPLKNCALEISEQLGFEC